MALYDDIARYIDERYIAAPAFGAAMPDMAPAAPMPSGAGAPRGYGAGAPNAAMAPQAAAPKGKRKLRLFKRRKRESEQAGSSVQERAASTLQEQETSAYQGQATSAYREQESLHDLLDALDEPFSTTLLALIDARGLADADVYKRAHMSRQLFSKIRSDAAYRPTKKTVLALAIALELDLPETNDLLRRAGFALSRSSKADIIVEYFIVHGMHDLMAVNEALYAFDQPLL